MLWKLLRTHVSPLQLVGFALANLFGLAIVLVAVQFYRDIAPLFSDDESFFRKDYLVVTRNVSGAGAMLGHAGEFSDDDIRQLRAQPWCRAVGRFVASDFPIQVTVGLGGGSRALRSQFFFEAIPADFIDVADGEWSFDPSRPQIPVIVPRDYLSLYNFGFAATQGLPRVSEGQMSMLPLSFALSGNGHSEVLSGRIVGFSSRVNTVIVPEAFMRWANERYGSGTPPTVRLIVEVSRPGDVAIEQYMSANRFDVAGDKVTAGRANYLLTLIVTLVVVVGVVISALSFFVLMLSIYLLLQKNSRKLQDLLLLGYSPTQVARPYLLLVVGINLAVLVLALGLMLGVRCWYLPMLSALGLAPDGVLVAVAVGGGIIALIMVGNVLAINRKVASLWRQ